MTTISLKNYLEQIDQLIDDGKFDDAIAHGRHILQSYPRNIEVYKLMGKAHLELRNHNEAVDLFQRVLSADPNDLVAHIGLSMIFKERGEDELALWHLERAFEIQPYNHAIREELRLLYIRFNDEVPPRLPLTPGAVARLYIRGELYQQAVQTLEPVVSTVQDRLDLEVLLAEALWQGRDDQRIDAEQVCLNVLERLPNSIMANAILATIWLRTGRVGESQKYLARVQDLTCLDHVSINADTPIGRAFLTDGAPALPEEITLQWLDNMPAPKQVQLSSADWMSEMDAELGGTGPIDMDEAEGDVVQEGESGMHSYDWMMDIEEPGDLAGGAMAAGAVMSDWFADEDVESDSQALTGDEEEVPEWLGDLSDDQPQRTGHTDELDYSFLEPEPSTEEMGSDWFADESTGSESNVLIDSEVPDWLVGADEDDIDKSAEATQADSDDEVLSGMPEWLASETGDLEPVVQDEAGTPDWLDDSLGDELDPIQMNPSEAEGWLDESDEAGAVMMQDSETQESEDEFEFLDLPSDDGGEDDWLSELDDGQTDDDLFAFDAEATGEESGDSDWLAAADVESEPDASLESDWLLEMTEDDTAVATESSADSDWLLGTDEETPAIEAEGDAIESVTSWLSDLDEDDELSELAEAEPKQIDRVPDDDWLKETTLFDTQGESSEVIESVTSWLSDLEADNEIETTAESDTSLAEEELDDDWLKETNLLEDVTDVAAAAAVTGWLSDFEEEGDEEQETAAADDGLGDLFIDDAAEPVGEGEEADDWLAELPEPEDEPQVAGELGSDWLTEDTVFASSDVDDEAIDELLATPDESALADVEEDLADSGDDWLSVLTQDDFDTSELEEIIPEELIAEDEPEAEALEVAEEEKMSEEDWSTLMYGADSLPVAPLEELGDLEESDIAEPALSEEEIANSQYDDIPDWLMTGPLDMDETPTVSAAASEAQHPGDVLDEDELFDSNPSEIDWEEDQALGWLTDLSESEGGDSVLAGEGAADDLIPDLADFNAEELEEDSELFSTNELLGFDQEDVPDWMSEADSASTDESTTDEEVGFTGLFDFEGVEDDVLATAVSAESIDEDAGLDDLLGWGDDDQESDVPESDELLDELLGEDVGLTDLLGWDGDDEDELETAVTAEADEGSSVTDFFEEDEDVFSDDFVFEEDGEEEDVALEEDIFGSTSFLAGTSLGQSDEGDEESSSAPAKSTAEFESELPELLTGAETSWLSELDEVGSEDSDKPEDKNRIGLDWLAEEPEDSLTDLLNTELEEPELSEIPDDEESEDELEDVDIGEDAYPGDINDAISWLEDLAVQQDAPLEELPTIAQDVLEDDDAEFEEAEESLDWLSDAEPIADATPAIEEFVGDEAVDDEAIDFEVNEEVDSAISWLDDLVTSEEDDIADEELDEALSDEFPEDVEPVVETDTLTDVEAELDDAMSWLDEIAVEPEDDLWVPEVADLEDGADELDLMEDLSEEVEDPELAADLDWLEQQVLSEGISISAPAVAPAAVSDQALDTALNWLEAQLAAPAVSPAEAALAEEVEELEAILLEEEEFEAEDLEIEELPDAEMLTGALAEEDGALFDMPDDPADAMAWLESMVAGDDDFTVEMEPPPIKPSEDAVYVDESLYGSSAETEEGEAVVDEISEELTVLDDLETAVDEEGEALEALDSLEAMPDLVEEETLDDLLEVDEDDPEAMFAALLAGDDFDIEMEPPPIKPSEDAVYVDESLYGSTAITEEVEEVVDELEVAADTAVDEAVEELESLESLEAIPDLVEEESVDDLLGLDEDDPEALFAALLAGDDFDIEMEPPPIKPSEDALYVDESLYGSSSQAEEVEEVVDELEGAVETAVDEAVEELESLESLEAMPDLVEEESVDDLLGLDEDDPEALFAALLAGDDFDIEMEPPPIKPSEDAVYVDESLYGSSSQAEEVKEVVDELEGAADTAVDEVSLSADLDSLLDVPDDPDEAVAWLEAMAASDDALEVESDLPPIKPSDDAVFVDESLYAAQDTAVGETAIADMPEDPDEAMAWLEKMADQQSVDEESPAPVEDAELDEELMPAWMMTGTEDLDSLLDDAPLEELGPPPDATPDEILDDSLGSPLDQDVHDALPSWLDVDDQEPPVGAQTGWLRTLPDLDVDSWLAAEEEATVRGFDEGTPLPLTSELSPTPSTTAELGGSDTEPDLFDADELEKDEFMVIEPDSSVSMYSIDENELKVAQDALVAENYEEAVAKYHELVSKGSGIMVLITELETVAEKHNDYPEFRRLLGDAYMRNGQLQKALDTYKDALNHL